jgi:MFS family permease
MDAPTDSQPPNEPKRGIRARIGESNVVRVLRYHDFRLLWIGAFVSFTGSWVQSVAQGYEVFRLTHDESKLAFVSFANSIPVFILGLAAGSLADVLEKKLVLTIAQLFFAAGALFLSAATYFGFAEYWHFPAVALMLGTVACIEMPTRQSIVSNVVPAEDLHAAVPLQAMTFNSARIFGPALGALLLTYLGVAACYFVNALSFLYLIRNVWAMKADLRPTARSPQPLRDLVAEGALYTWRDTKLKTLLILESLTALFGIAYMPMLPAYVREELGMSEAASKPVLGNCYTAIGVGALVGLLAITQFSRPRHRAVTIRLSIWVMAGALFLLSLVTQPFYAYLVLPFLGMASIAQLNSTNTLFQILAPERLRGRVLAMHIWALNGLSPFGVLLFGWIAAVSRRSDTFQFLNLQLHHGSVGVELALKLSAAVMLVTAILGTWFSRGLNDLAKEEAYI